MQTPARVQFRHGQTTIFDSAEEGSIRIEFSDEGFYVQIDNRYDRFFNDRKALDAFLKRIKATYVGIDK